MLCINFARTKRLPKTYRARIVITTDFEIGKCLLTSASTMTKRSIDIVETAIKISLDFKSMVSHALQCIHLYCLNVPGVGMY